MPSGSIGIGLDPFCVLMPYNGIDPLFKRHELIDQAGLLPDNASFGALIIKCVLRNVGVGPALNVRVTFKSQQRAGWESEAWELSPLGAGESRGSEGNHLLIPIRINDGFNISDLSGFPDEPWEIWLEYKDVFGARFCSVHHKRPLRQEEGLKPIPAQAPGTGPRFIYSPLPWVTFPKRCGA